MIRIVTLVWIAVLLGGCAHHRDPMAIQMKQAGDEDLTCGQIQAEYCSSVEIAGEKIKKNNENDVHDVLLVIFVWPGLADMKNADGIEGNALLDRCIHLKNLAVGKGCDTAPYPAPPERYK